MAGVAAGLLPACRPTELPADRGVAPAWAPGRPLPWINWGGNQACQPAGREAPGGEEELLAWMARGQGSFRPVGAGHSFSALVPSDGTLVATDRISGLVAADAGTRRAEVGSGTRLHQLGPLLGAHGLALPNLPDIDYQTLGGAIATSTHGSGARLGSLSAQVEGLALATSAGELLECDAGRNPEVFQAARCSLGALGVTTRFRLRGQAPFHLAEVTRIEPLEDLLDDVVRRRAEHRHFEFYAFPHLSMAMSVTTDEVEPGPIKVATENPEAIYQLRDVYRRVGGIPWLGDTLYEWIQRRSIEAVEAVRRGPSYAVLTHDRLVRFREMEYTVPADAGPACLREVLRTIDEKRIPVVFPIEYRYTRHDDIWLSPFYQRDGCSISVHEFADRDYRPYFAEIEPIFWRYQGRPHWGKLHSLDARRLAGLYPRWKEFGEVRGALDPAGRLLNAHLRAVLGA